MKAILYDGPKSLSNASEKDQECLPENLRDIRLKRCIDTRIEVDGEPCFVYDTNVNHSRSWEENYYPALSRTPIAYFDFEGKADIKITVLNQDIKEVSVHPLSYGIEAVINETEHTISFSITNPDTYTVMLNGSPERAIHIFANGFEMEVPDKDDENVIYIGPGEWDLGTIRLQSGQTLYLAGGAVVHGNVLAEGISDVRVLGRGIIDGSWYEVWKGNKEFVPLQFDHCRNVVVKDVILLNANAWVCQGFDTENMVIDGLKIVSCRPNGDGITLQSCKNVEVRNCFVRSWDDSLVIKNYAGNTEHIHFSDIQIWTDFAQSMEIGYETNKGKFPNSRITDVTFADICVLHNYHKPVISIHNADEATVEDVVFQRITVEDAQMGEGDGNVMPYLLDFIIAGNLGWATTDKRGRINNILVEDVNVLSGKFCASRIQGFDKEHMVSDIIIRNMVILGNKITRAEDGKVTIEKETVKNIIWE